MGRCYPAAAKVIARVWFYLTNRELERALKLQGRLNPPSALIDSILIWANAAVNNSQITNLKSNNYKLSQAFVLLNLVVHHALLR